MGLNFKSLSMDGVMVCNNFSIRMTPLYHLILSDIAFKKKNGFIAKKLSNYVSVEGGEDIYAKDYSFDETDYVYLSKRNIGINEIKIDNVDIISIRDEVGKELEKEKRLLVEDDVVITRSGTIGITVLITKDMLKEKKLIPSGYVKVLKANKEVLPKFLAYYLSNQIIRELMEIEATGKDQKNLSNPAVCDLPFPSISTDDQKKVLDAVEEIQKRINKLNLEYRNETEIINTIFNKVLPFSQSKEEKIYEKQVNLENLGEDKYFRTDPDYFEYIKEYNTFIKKNNHIKFSRLENYLEAYESGKPIDRGDYADVETDYVHIVPRDIQTGRFHLKDPIYINYNKGEELREFRCRKGDILLVISSNVGDATIFDMEDKKYTISHYIANLRVKNINKKFLVYYFYYAPINLYFRAIETGKGQKNLPHQYIFDLKVPELTNQEEIVKEIDGELDKHSKIKKELIGLKKDIDVVFWSELHRYAKEKNK